MANQNYLERVGLFEPEILRSGEMYSGLMYELLKKYGHLPNLKFQNYENAVGIEVELENIKDYDSPCGILWTKTEDGSLKNRGIELVSIPLKKHMIDYAIHELGRFFNANPEITVGHRTSIHVHCNVGRMTEPQLLALMALYATYEECFFSFVDRIREGSSYCYHLVGTDTKLRYEGTKYCAFNVSPIYKQGTVEFRHLEGTKNTVKIRRWIALCAKLVDFAHTLDKDKAHDEALDMLCSRQFDVVGNAIWGETFKLFDMNVLEFSANKGAPWGIALIERNT
jgi:hypothetical protein